MKYNSNFPYPVLHPENDDYINSKFESDLNIFPEFGVVKISTNFHLQNSCLNELVRNKLATFSVHVECPQTSFRQLYETTEDNLEIMIEKEKLRGRIFVHAFLIAKEPIENYHNDQLNEWYENIEISYQKGNILAIGDSIESTMLEDHTDLMNLPSIISVRKSHDGDVMDVEMLSNSIVISLPAYEYDQYAANANSRLKNSIMTSIILPSLVQIFASIQGNAADYEEYTWYQVLQKIFQASNHSLEEVGTERLSPLKAAQLVLQRPLKSSFEEIEKLNQMED